MRLLLVEDATRLREALSLGLRKSGYAVDSAGDGEEGLWLAQTNNYDAMILDLMLPKLDGLTVLGRLRESGKETPVLILTVKNEIEDRVGGLRAGADDYLPKPFAFDELLARIEALIRRKYGNKNPVLRVGEIELHTDTRQTSFRQTPIPLTPREYRILEFLIRRQGQVVTKTEIEEHIYSDETEVFSNTVESTISSLRKKLELAGGPPMIHTKRGMGYLLGNPPP